MASPFSILSLFLVSLSVTSQGLSTSSLKDATLAVPVATQELTKVATSILEAETWLRTHVLSHYPASKITHIVAGHDVLCLSQTHQTKLNLMLPALKNLHHSLTRWGLQNEIKVSPSLSFACFNPSLEREVQPLLDFIKAINSTHFTNPTSSKIDSLAKPTMRKLSFVIPPIPTAEGPLPPLVGPSPMGLSPSPVQPPHPHHHHHFLPPCNPSPPPPPPYTEAPVEAPLEKVWCVAKPSVPAETLQEAMDYACGEGEAECDEIKPNGNCYFPDNLVAHASFAFNSYWQKSKNNGATCSFGGTAMLINSDPSYLQCRFIVS